MQDNFHPGRKGLSIELEDMDTSPPLRSASFPLFPSRCISLTVTLLRCHSKWAYRQLQGSRHWELHIARVFITLALTFTQMGRQSSFVFIFSRPAALSLHLSRRGWWLWKFVIFRGPSRSQTCFTLMGQLPSTTAALETEDLGLRRRTHCACSMFYNSNPQIHKVLLNNWSVRLLRG